MSDKKDLMQDLLYMQLLQPDDGYKVDFAVGCTFSLSLEGLISVPLAFSKMGDTKDLDNQTAMYLMEGILRYSDTFVLFCNKGSIHTPQNCPSLYSLVDSTVVEVSSPEKPLANFHSKMWVIREKPQTGNGTAVIKLIVMSRNLTFTKDLEVAIAVKGEVCKGVSNDKNRSLAEMLRDLADEYDDNKERRKKIKKLADDFEKVECFDFESPFSTKVYELHPTLFHKSGTCFYYNNNTFISRLQGKRVLIISPFLDSDTDQVIVNNIIKKAEKKYLLTRENNVTQPILDIFDEVYVPNPGLTDDDNYPVNLHSKIYLIEQGNGAVYLYLGSTNATHNAFIRNSELSIGIRVNDYSFDQMFDELVKKEGLYIQVSEPMVDAVEEKEMRKIENDKEHVMRWAMNSLVTAKIIKNQDANKPPYHIKLWFEAVDKQKYDIIDKCLREYSVSIRPLQCMEAKSVIRNKMTFNWNMQLEELSEFYVVEVCNSDSSSKKSGVCKVATEGLELLIEKRKERVVNTIINRDNLLQYIEMMLSDFPEYTFEKWNQRREQIGKSSTNDNNLWGEITFYEQLLKASYENPSKLENLKSVLSKLPNDEFPEEMGPLLECFDIKMKRKRKKK